MTTCRLQRGTELLPHLLEARPPQRFFLVAAGALPLRLALALPLPFFLGAPIAPAAFSSARRSCSSSVFSAFSHAHS